MPYSAGSRTGSTIATPPATKPITTIATRDPFKLGEQEFRDHMPAHSSSSSPSPSSVSLSASSGASAGDEMDSEQAANLHRQNLERFRSSTRDYAIWGNDRYKQATARSFDHVVANNDEYKAALFDAARQCKPVILMFGAPSDPATRQIVENSLKDGRDRSCGQGVFVFVDLDRIDQNSSICRYAEGLIEKHGFPMTVCFTLRPGDEFNPARSDVPLYHQTGPVSSFKLLDAINRGTALMSGMQFLHLPVIKSLMPVVQIESAAADMTPPAAKQESLPASADWPNELSESAQLIQRAKAEGVDRKAAYELLRQAVKSADQADDYVMKSAARAELGFACMDWGFPEQGIAWLLDAGKKNPEIYLNSKFVARVKQCGLAPAAAEELLYEGMRNPTWYEENKKQALTRLLTSSSGELAKPISAVQDVTPVRQFPSPFSR